MSSTSVSILVPLMRGASELPSTLESVEQYLQTSSKCLPSPVVETGLPAGLRQQSLFR